MRRLEIAGLAAGYGRRRVIHDLSLAPLQAGTLTAVVGPNGAGKSTVLRALAGLLPARGRIDLGAVDLARMTLAERARHVAYMPQGLPQGVQLNILETLVAALKASPPISGELTSDQAGKRGLSLLERLGIGRLALSRLDMLSGGQRQLAALAQALVREPEVLLLDEPTSALDLHFQLSVMGLVRQTIAATGMVGIVVLHDLGLVARFADRVVVMQDGRMEADGTTEQTLTETLLGRVYGVAARVERCSQGGLVILADRPLDSYRLQDSSRP